MFSSKITVLVKKRPRTLKEGYTADKRKKWVKPKTLAAPMNAENPQHIAAQRVRGFQKSVKRAF
jgi:hypothetical protein